MVEISGTNVGAGIVPFTTDDVFATHNSIYGKGGYREVKTLEERDNIKKARRSKGMLVYVEETDSVYKLTDVELNTYIEFKSGTINYNELINKPKINGVEITGEKTLDELNIASKSTTLAGYGITDAYTKTDIDSKLSSVYKFKGTVNDFASLPKVDVINGDVYNTKDTGDNYAWVAPTELTEGFWDKLAGNIDLSPYLTSELASKTYATQTNVTEELNKKQNTLIQGENITIDEFNNISAHIDLSNYYTIEQADSAINSYNPDAKKVGYINGEITTVQQALDKLLYIAPVVKSFTGGGTYEIGQKVSQVSLAWVLNKDVNSQNINQGIGAISPELRSHEFIPDVPIDSNTTFTITVSDGVNNASKSTSINFMHKRYWGVSVNESLTNEEILKLSSEFSSNRKQSRVFDCSGGKYFYFVIPTSYCNGISFKVGGLAFSAMNVETVAVTNASGNISNFNIYRCSNPQTGSSISVEVL